MCIDGCVKKGMIVGKCVKMEEGKREGVRGGWASVCEDSADTPTHALGLYGPSLLLQNMQKYSV